MLQAMTKFVFVTGGVVSSLGKGIASASLAAILESRGLKVTLIKLDPYLNVDPGTMSPFQHGEVFVTDDGAETDLDLGHYERFSSNRLTRSSNWTTGRIYQSVIDKMGRATVSRFARFYVIPQTGHGLSGKSESEDADGRSTGAFAIPNTYRRLQLLFDWVEHGTAPHEVVVTAGDRSLPLCEYPEYPRYVSGPVTAAASYRCTRP